MAAEHSLTRELRSLLTRQRTAALGTLDETGAAFVSMVPFAIDADHRSLVIHVSALAAHSGNLQRSPRASLLVCTSEVAGEPVHALPRATMDVRAAFSEPDSPMNAACRQAYLARFPEAEPMTKLGDFRFVQLTPLGARQVAGFGSARTLPADELARALGPAP
jgi:heme iron utilization protein